MRPIQKAAAAAIALTITLLGTAFVTAPFALADMQSAAVHQVASMACTEHNSRSTGTPSLRHG